MYPRPLCDYSYKLPCKAFSSARLDRETSNLKLPIVEVALAMSTTVFPVAVVYVVLLAMFAAGTRDDKQLNSLFRRSVGRRARDKNANVVGAHEIIRKQSESICSNDEYDARMEALECDVEYMKAVREPTEKNRCIYFVNEGSGYIFKGCGTNHNGTFCSELNERGKVYRNAFDVCFGSSDRRVAPSAGDCENECQLALRQLSDQVGCCIHNINPYASLILVTPSLWINCGVVLPEPCTDTPQPIDEVPYFACSYDCVLRQFISLYCKSVGEKLEKLDRECNQAEGFERCGFDKGDFCSRLDFPTSYFVTIYDKCYSFFEEKNVTNGVCPSECSEALLDAKDTYGCCLKYYNKTFNDYEEVGYAVMKSDLWAACDIETLDSCVILPPPDDFLDKCSQESGGGGGGTIHVSLTNIYSIVVIVTTLFITTQPYI